MKLNLDMKQLFLLLATGVDEKFQAAKMKSKLGV